MRLYADADIASLGIVTGCENGTFQLTRELSHQEAAVILHRLYNVLYGTVSSENSAKIYADNAVSAFGRRIRFTDAAGRHPAGQER